MNRSCLRTEETNRAAMSGEWSGELKSHARQCRECSEMLWIGESLRSFADSGSNAATLPHPALFLLKAERERAAKQRDAATRPIRIVGRLAVAILGVSGMSVLLWKGTALGQWLIPASAAQPLPDAIPLHVLTAGLVGLAFVLWGLIQLTLFRLIEE